MPKDKRRLVDEEARQKTMFYYEIIGSILIILSITTLAKLGKVGNIITILFKSFFGDWYFIFLLFFLFLGFYNLFLHTGFNFKHHRFIGFSLLSLIFLLSSHFSIHEYALSGEEGYLDAVFSIYKEYINTGDYTALGGGILGAVLFFLIYYLLGVTGVILVIIILFILSLSLILNIPFSDMGLWCGKRIGKLGLKFKSFTNFFKYDVGKEMEIIRKKYVKLTLKDFLIVPYEYLERRNEEVNEKDNVINELIINIFGSKIEFNKLSYVISYTVTTFYYKLENLKIRKDEFNTLLLKLYKEIKVKYDDKVLFSIENEILAIQVKNYYKEYLQVRKLLITSSNLENKFPLGIDYQNNIVSESMNSFNVLVICDIGFGIRNFLFYLCSYILYKHRSSEINLFIYDPNNCLSGFSYLSKDTDNIINTLDSVKEYADNILEELNKNRLTSFNDYLNKKSTLDSNLVIKRTFVIISPIVSNITSEKLDLLEIEKRLLYLTQISSKIGMVIIYCLDSKEYINNTINSVFPKKIFFKSSKSLISYFAYSNSDPLLNALYIDENTDAIYNGRRIVIPVVSKEEEILINKRIKKEKV